MLRASDSGTLLESGDERLGRKASKAGIRNDLGRWDRRLHELPETVRTRRGTMHVVSVVNI